jgi:hypothetical protein
MSRAGGRREGWGRVGWMLTQSRPSDRVGRTWGDRVDEARGGDQIMRLIEGGPSLKTGSQMLLIASSFLFGGTFRESSLSSLSSSLVGLSILNQLHHLDGLGLQFLCLPLNFGSIRVGGRVGFIEHVVVGQNDLVDQLPELFLGLPDFDLVVGGSEEFVPCDDDLRDGDCAPLVYVGVCVHTDRERRDVHLQRHSSEQPGRPRRRHRGYLRGVLWLL